MQEIRRAYPDDFDLQILIADAQQEVIERARALRKDGTTTGVEANLSIPVSNPVSRPAVEEYPEAAEMPPDVPKLDRKSWRLAVGLAILFTVGTFALFFYLIQMARRLYFFTPSAPAQGSCPCQTCTEG